LRTVAFHLIVGAEPLSGYRLVSPLGRGGFGEVWKAERPGGGHVALKFVPLDSDAAAVERRALDFIAGVRHPNLLALFGSWPIEGFLMIGMELADHTLQHRYEEARAEGLAGIPFAELVDYLDGAARGLDYLNTYRHPHPQGDPVLVSFQHRDVKPTNLFLVGGGVKVGDWGLLRMLESTSGGHTGHLTPGFAAPEFFRGRTSSHSDQYSLAATAYFLRTGRLLFGRDPWDGHLNRPPDLSLVENPGERRALERALAKESNERWPSSRAFVDALRAALPTAPAASRPEAVANLSTVGQVRPTVPATGLNVPRFHYGSVVPPQYFIGREGELAEALEVVTAGQSFLIVGLHRSGKTSFCKKLIHEIMGRPHNQMLAAYLNLQQLVDLTVETFLEHTLLNLMGEIARQVFRCKYTDLFRPDAAASHPHLRDNPAFESFVYIFRLVVSRTQSTQGSSPPPLRSQEFVQFTNDLLDIVRRCGWSKFVIFYDEANRLPRELSVDLLVSNEEALNVAGVVSVYVASPVMAAAFGPVYDLFGRELRLGPFAGIEDLRRLLARYYFDDVTRTDELPVAADAIQLLWSVSRGRPFLIQLIAGRSFECARAEQAIEVQTRHVEEAHRALLAAKPQCFADEPTNV
jgi:serine/threonine protein kinase